MHNSDLCSALPADEQVAVFTDKSSFIDFAYDSFFNLLVWSDWSIFVC